MTRLTVGISGATGIIYGVRTLEILAALGVETHLVVTHSAVRNMQLETDFTLERLHSLASTVYDVDDTGAPIASGSYKIDGMVVAPCSIKSLSAIANSFNYNLLIRAADVTLKERRRLVLMVRETPLHEGHLELMLRVTRMGGIILPPVPALYHMPKTIDDIVNQSVGKMLDTFSIDARLFKRWGTPDDMDDAGAARTGDIYPKHAND